MPTYKVKRPDGRVIRLVGPNPPSEAQLDRIFATLEAQGRLPKGPPRPPDLDANRQSVRSGNAPDYDALAQQHGGAPAPDYGELAAQNGGYLSSDPNAGLPTPGRLLSTDPSAGLPVQSQLVQRIREKYPDAYRDLTDVELEQAVLAKYPQYADKARRQPVDRATFMQVKDRVVRDAPPGMSRDQFNLLLDSELAKLEQAAPTFRSTNERDHSGAATLRPEDRGFSVGNVVQEGTQSVNPVNWAKALGSIVTDPMGVARSMYEGRTALSDAAAAAFRKGDYVRGTAKTIEWLIPFLGERMSQAGDWMEAGEWDKGIGAMIDVAGQIALPKALNQPAVRNARVGTPRPLRNRNPVEQAAVEFGMREGIPVDAATASGNPFVRGVQRVADESIGGSFAGERAKHAQAEAFTRTGGRLMDRTSSSAVTAEQAGEGLRAGVRDTVRRHAGEADTAYARLRQFEAQATPTTVQTGAKTSPTGVLDASGNPVSRTTPITQSARLAVDVKAAREQLRPLYDRLKRESELVPLQGDKARALTALDRLMQGPDIAPLSVVDEALSDLKTMARVDIPELRSAGKGAAALAVKQLDSQVRTAAAKAGLNVLKALEQGRAATKAKYAAGDVLESLRAESVGVFRQATAPRDAAVGLLRELRNTAPNELPKVGRAVLEDLLTTATAEGGFNRAQGLQAKWLQLGPETKKLLYRDAELIKDLDRFFLLAKKAAENPNPSGTALTLTKTGEVGLIFTNSAIGVPTTIGAAVLSRMLHSPRLVRLLNRGLLIPVKAKAAASATVAELLTAAREAGVRLAPATDREGRGPLEESSRPLQPSAP